MWSLKEIYQEFSFALKMKAALFPFYFDKYLPDYTAQHLGRQYSSVCQILCSLLSLSKT
jgi:hypothetical protein